MYTNRKASRLGVIPWQLVVGVVDIGAQAGLKAGSYATEKKYQNRTKRVLRSSRAEAEKLQDQTIEQRRRLAQQGLQTARSQTEGFKKLLGLTLGVAILVSGVGLGVFYFGAKGAE